MGSPKTTLKLIEPLETGAECCTRHKPCSPESKCSFESEELKCVWWVSSPENGNCFWRYVKSRSDEEGSMDALTHSEIYDLLGWSSKKTYSMLKAAMEELQDALNRHNASDLLVNDGLDLDTLSSLSDLLDSPSDFE